MKVNVRSAFEGQAVAAVKEILSSMGVEDADIRTEIPDNHDLAIPCFTFSKKAGMPPKELAEAIRSGITQSGLISSASALNGYLNFDIKWEDLAKETLESIIEKGSEYGAAPKSGLRVNVEHTSTNPTGPIHVGRARNPIIGDTLARCLKRCGHDVSTEYYVNDVGKQVVILTWGVNNISTALETGEERDKTDHRLVAYYRAANAMMESDSVVSEQISKMLRRFEAGDADVIRNVRKTAEAMLDGLKITLDGINVTLDRYTWESDFIADGSAAKVVSDLKSSKYASQTEDGSWNLDLKEFGIQGKNTRFTFTRSDGTTLYTTRDLAYHIDKFSRSDRAIDVLGEDQKLGSKQLCSALEILGCDRAPEAMFYSFVSLPEGKMSTRKGVVVYLDDLIDEAVGRAREEVLSRRSDLPKEKVDEIAAAVGIGAVRFNIIRVQPEKQLVFKWDEALSFDGNSGPYLQYVHARACSMLKRAGGYSQDADPSKLTDEYEVKLIKILSKFGSVLTSAGEMRRVHLLPAYGHELASAFNQFYAAVPVISSGSSRDARLTLVECSKTVLANVLDCLGIEALEEM
ncbi:MAG: arginine--tRNA ligase [Candidatus Methanoplasma sp.]|jgi:arginyl-tRNA synthetase|nr:arginine--tRNA ligase [Candidatus Methanoplasma sp.]